MLYHREVKWFDRFDIESSNLITNRMKITKHLKEHTTTGKYRYNYSMNKVLALLYKAKNDGFKPFEVETDEKGEVVKFAVRIAYNEFSDITIVVRYGVIVTAYKNKKEDSHRTLDRTKYEN